MRKLRNRSRVWQNIDLTQMSVMDGKRGKSRIKVFTERK